MYIHITYLDYWRLQVVRTGCQRWLDWNLGRRHDRLVTTPAQNSLHRQTHTCMNQNSRSSAFTTLHVRDSFLLMVSFNPVPACRTSQGVPGSVFTICPRDRKTSGHLRPRMSLAEWLSSALRTSQDVPGRVFTISLTTPHDVPGSVYHLPSGHLRTSMTVCLPPAFRTGKHQDIKGCP